MGQERCMVTAIVCTAIILSVRLCLDERWAGRNTCPWANHNYATLRIRVITVYILVCLSDLLRYNSIKSVSHVQLFKLNGASCNLS